MTKEVRLWGITEGDDLCEIFHSKLNLEERIENWLEKDICIISKELMVIGRQVETDYGGLIDLLCLDISGDVVIIELKRDKTPRDTVAQALDYASWVKELGSEKISDIFGSYLNNRVSIEEAYTEKFKLEYPEVINDSHKMIIVASEIDSSLERIIKYLSSTHGVDINVITFNYFQGDDGREYLSRVFLIEPSDVEYRSRTKASSKKTKSLNFEEALVIAKNLGIGEVFTKTLEGFRKYYSYVKWGKGSVTLYDRLDDGESLRSLLTIAIKESDSRNGLVVHVYFDRLAKYANIDKEALKDCFPPSFEMLDYKDYADGYMAKTYFKSVEEVNRTISKIASHYRANQPE